MRAIAFVLACLVCASHGRRVQRAAEKENEGTPEEEHQNMDRVPRIEEPRQLDAFSRLLMGLSPSVGWQTAFPSDHGLASKKRIDDHAASRSNVLVSTGLDENNGAPQLLRANEGGARHSSVLMPSVAYSVPKASREDWIKAYSRFYPERISHLGQEIDDFVINQIISLMIFMDAEDSKSPQYLYINSPGGSVIAGLALYDTMQHISSPVITANLGMAASMASFLLGAGVRGKRLALPGSWVMIHQPMAGVEAETTDKRVEAEQVYRIKETILDMYAEMTGKTRSQIEVDLAFDNYMPSEKAVEYGLIDKIAAFK